MSKKQFHLIKFAYKCLLWIICLPIIGRYIVAPICVFFFQAQQDRLVSAILALLFISILFYKLQYRIDGYLNKKFYTNQF